MNSSPLRRLSRDIRATRPWRRAHSARQRRSPAADFVAGILARHARGIATVFGPEHLTRRAAAHVVAVHRHYQRNVARLALHFDIRLAPALRARMRPAPFLPRTAGRGDRAPPARTAAGPSLVQRIVARERRVETLTTMRDALRDVLPAERAGAAPPSRARPVEMVPRRPRAPVPEAPRTAPTAAPSRDVEERGARLTLLRPAAIDASPPLSAAELGRVTDHVVRAIDRRFIAQRERRGRI